MENGGSSSRRRLTHQLSVFDPSNLRDIIRVRDDDDNNRDSLAGLTLRAVLGCEEKRSAGVPPVSRTLLDIINEESGSKDLSGRKFKSWKSFRDRLRLRRASAAWASSSADGDDDDFSLRISDPIPTTAVANSIESSQLGNGPDGRFDITEYEAVAAANEPVMMRLAAALAVERGLQRQRDQSNPVPVIEEVREEPVVEPVVSEPVATEPAAVEEEPPVRMSLMALLEETDRQAGFLGSTLTGDAAEEEEEEEADGDADDDGGEYVCCVCMVRHKGAAFIPCGHTFCRLCSRELWVTRGNCPLCNGFILEILDIF